MEASVGTISEGEWNSSFVGICSDEADFMAQLLGGCSTPNELSGGPHFPTAWPVYETNAGFEGESSMYCSDEITNNNNNGSMYSSWSGTSNNNNSQDCNYPGGSDSHQFFGGSSDSMTMDHYWQSKDNVMELGYHEFMNHDIISNGSDTHVEAGGEKLQVSGDSNYLQNFQLGLMEQKLLIPEQPLKEAKSGIISPCEVPKKRPRINGEVQRNKRSMKMKNCRKFDGDEEDNNNNNNNNNNNRNAVLNRQSSSVGCSEDDSSVTHEIVNGSASGLSLKESGPGSRSVSEKTRAGRGSATDPQSLYARKRRERINERLRVLQNLVPNGTKVDISTMLEEAVEYVKFLQLQIKLLSSDDMWMYSPIAYNGMDLGLDLKISSQKSQS